MPRHHIADSARFQRCEYATFDRADLLSLDTAPLIFQDARRATRPRHFDANVVGDTSAFTQLLLRPIDYGRRVGWPRRLKMLDYSATAV